MQMNEIYAKRDKGVERDRDITEWEIKFKRKIKREWKKKCTVWRVGKKFEMIIIKIVTKKSGNDSKR